jgi:hypothetical protein
MDFGFLMVLGPAARAELAMDRQAAAEASLRAMEAREKGSSEEVCGLAARLASEFTVRRAVLCGKPPKSGVSRTLL